MNAINQILLCLLLPTTATGFAYAAERVTYYHTDALGSPTAATDQQGNVVWRETYEPYGERIKKEPAASTNDRWHTGHVLDAETGLQYAGARYYDPVLGRFMGVDPAFFTEKNPHSFNQYAYGANNPYKYVDPDGREITGAGSYVVKNVYLKKELSRLNNAIIDVTGLNDRDFRLEITGGDRYTDNNGVIRSSTDDSVINTKQISEHLDKNGNRGLDIQVENVSPRAIDRALKEGTNLSPDNTNRNYGDGHTHISLPDLPKYRNGSPAYEKSLRATTPDPRSGLF